MMTSEQVLKKFLQFYKKKGHKQIPNMSLVPENDPSLIFVNSGMFPLVPYLFGEKHPLGKRLMNIQRCIRFDEDIDDVGKTIRHTSVFHQLGNWSLGDYFKEEQLHWLYEFVVEELGLDITKIYASVFRGDKDAPRDTESVKILKDIFAKYGIEAQLGERIFEYDKSENWWKRGDAIGEPGGPDSEIFYFVGDDPSDKNPLDNDDKFIEMGNSVFMQYKKTKNGWEELSQKNIDFGGGFERLVMFVQGKNDIFEIDDYWPIIERIQEVSGRNYYDDDETKVGMRLLADHMRACVLIAMDGVIPSNTEQGYILRQYLRRMVRAGMKLGVKKNITLDLVESVTVSLSWLYPNLPEQQDLFINLFSEEEKRFRKVLQKGSRQVDNLLLGVKSASSENLADIAFNLYQSVGYPFEIFLEDIKDRGIKTDLSVVESLYKSRVKKHKDKSRKGAEQKFKGGLADKSEKTIKLHTATHLLQWALREVLGDNVVQRGSNITSKRLRFDFPHNSKLSEEEIKQVEKLVNKKIASRVPVQYEILPKTEAEKTGALHAFGEKYGNKVKVYYIGSDLNSAFSKEFCGGPHVSNTKELGKFKITRQKRIGTNLLRVYATLKQ